MKSKANSGRRQPNLVAGLVSKTIVPVISLFGISMISNLLMLTGPLFMLQVYDRVLASRSIPTLVSISAIVCGLYAFYAFVEWIRSRMAIRFAGMIDEAAAENLFKASVRLKLQSGTKASPDPVRDLDAVRQFAAGQGPISLFDLPWIPVYLAFVFLLHPMLGWLAVAGATVITLMLVVNERMSHEPSQDVSASSARRQLQTDDARLNAESVVAMGMMGAVSSRWHNASDAMVSAQHKAADGAAVYSSVTKSLRFLLQSAVLALGAYLTIRGEITGGVMIAASIISSRALAPVELLVGQWRSFVTARQALRRIDLVLNEFKETKRTMELPLPSKSLTITQASLAPARNQKITVGGLNFSLVRGEGLGILGPSGSGKTSLVRGLVGVWPIVHGDIRLDDSELSHFDPERLGAAIGYLPQTVDLFDGTVAENISRFRSDATSERVLRAADLANVHELIASLPDGYETRIGDRGAALSAGQRQRIGLARALYGDPFLIVLDEPNSNLDAEGDAALASALVKSKSRGAIAIVVAHRPSAISSMDKILFLQAGRQVAFGPKDEILAKITQQSQSSVAAFGSLRAHG
jgi:ATP-binding cassette, subfamily C, bacterial PrsD